MAQNRRLDFRNLPLIEAAVRATFSAPKPLSYALINSIAEALKPSFPAVTEPTQVEVAPGTGETQFAFGPGYIPGAVYTGHKQGLSVSLQPQVIVARWVKSPALHEPSYPRYPELRKALWAAVEAFRANCDNEKPSIVVVNMSYANFVPLVETASFLTTYLAVEARLPLMNAARQVRKLEAAWTEADDIDLRYAVEQAAARLPDAVTPGYRLTTAAGLRLGESLDAKSGLDMIHEKLQKFFLELISDQAKDEWNLKVIDNE